MDSLPNLQVTSGFPGYDDDVDRRRSDGLVRAYLGERLAELTARIAPISSEHQQRIDALLLRAGFADPKAFSARNGLATDAPNGATIDDIAADDVQTISVADRAESVDAANLGAYLDEVTAVFTAETPRCAQLPPRRNRHCRETRR